MRIRRLLLALAAPLALAGAPPLALSRPRPLLVSAASSLRGVLEQLAPAFVRGLAVRGLAVPRPTFNFAASGVLQRQIEQGAPVDVFLSAGGRQMEALEQQGLLLAGSRRDLIGNRLVLVVPSARRSPLGIRDLADPRIRRIAIGDSAVPAGDYARQVLRHYNLTRALRDRLVPLGSVRAVATAVAGGSADAGLVYRSDAVADPGLRITATAPASSHAPIRYSGAVLRRSTQPALARAYLDSLATPAARSAFLRRGFAPLPVGG